MRSPNAWPGSPPPATAFSAGLASTISASKGSSPSSRAAPNGEAAAKASSTLGGGAVAPEKAVSTSMAACGRASVGWPAPFSRIRNRRAPSGETLAACSAPPTLMEACPVSPRRAAPSAVNRLEADAPVLGRRGASPIIAFQARLAACTRPSEAAMAAGSERASISRSALTSSETAGSATPRRAKTPRQATPARPTSSIIPPSVAGPAVIAGAAAKPTAARKKTTTRAVSRSNRPFSALRVDGPAMASV